MRNINGPPNIWLADLPPAGEASRLLNIRRLTFSQSEQFPHAWTSDSRKIVFESNQNGPYDLYSQDIDGRASKPLVVSPLDKVMAQLSPDGNSFLYHDVSADRRLKVMRIPVHGGSPEVVLMDSKRPGEFRCGLQAGARCVVRQLKTINSSFTN